MGSLGWYGWLQSRTLHAAAAAMAADSAAAVVVAAAAMAATAAATAAMAADSAAASTTAQPPTPPSLAMMQRELDVLEGEQEVEGTATRGGRIYGLKRDITRYKRKLSWNVIVDQWEYQWENSHLTAES